MLKIISIIHPAKAQSGISIYDRIQKPFRNKGEAAYLAVFVKE
jgi:hypothetical protein